MTIAVARAGAPKRRGGGRDRPQLRGRGYRPRQDGDSGIRVRRRPLGAAHHPPGRQPRAPGSGASTPYRRSTRRSARSRTAPGRRLEIGRNHDGTEVLSAYETIELAGLAVFVEEPLSEAFAPIEAAIWRTALLLVAFLILAIATGVVLARRLVRPIESVQAAAAKIGSGALDERIEVTSDDELGALANRVQPHGFAASGVVRGPRAESGGEDAGARLRAGGARREETASSSWRASTSPNSWRTCRTSCGRR